MGDPFADDHGPQFQVVPAELEAVPALIVLWGLSDSGKTYSALRLARGLVGESGKIVVIDTENKRSKFYAGKFGGWSHIDLQPPFTAERYSAALTAAVMDGADVVIVDSFSHVWEGEGGVLDQADRVTTKGLGKWKAPKMAYKRMVNNMLRSPVHVIFCLREKDKNVQTGRGNESQIVNLGPVPICGSGFVYEATVSAHMESGTRRPLEPVKAPEEIAHAITPGEFITEHSGEVIAEWLRGGKPVDQETADEQRRARDVASLGRDAFDKHWKGLKKPQREMLRPILGELKELTEEADKTADPEPDSDDEPFDFGEAAE